MLTNTFQCVPSTVAIKGMIISVTQKYSFVTLPRQFLSSFLAQELRVLRHILSLRSSSSIELYNVFFLYVWIILTNDLYVGHWVLSNFLTGTIPMDTVSIYVTFLKPADTEHFMILAPFHLFCDLSVQMSVQFSSCYFFRIIEL
ncbi:rCG28888 [Rattus norvegicus]|uniref:RCG28888 n=1 Tax=Rattus norvegicus TaxID=10116 RepID=A6HVC8_RAT|nr:rCG28888 [Rattus norvegicus]